MNLDDQKLFEKRQFTENIGMFFESQHLPRMAGRIMGWLLICVPAHQTANEIGETLEMSKGSVSTMTRLLIQMGMIEKVSRIGERREYYRILPIINGKILRSRLEEFSQLNNLVNQGLALMNEETPEDQERLNNLNKMCSLVTQSLSITIFQIENAGASSGTSKGENNIPANE